MYHVFVVSDGTGGTAERALNAALVQFVGVDIKIEKRIGIRTEEQIRETVQEASTKGAFIVHTLVSDKLREFIFHTGRLNNIETIDLIGPLLARLSQYFTISPAEKPGLFHQLNEKYYRRIETIEFAFHHDDGLRADELMKAEIVLVGVSRTFKTPLSIYLASKGWFVANIPIIMSMEIPPLLSKIREGFVFGLKADPVRLADLRRVRHEYLKQKTGNYGDPDYVRKEMKFALRLFSQNIKWPVIDVTDKPIEEIASEILAIKKQFK
jgi:regulator of PEP synthase PpsR (kinase-PPPase family)